MKENVGPRGDPCGLKRTWSTSRTCHFVRSEVHVDLNPIILTYKVRSYSLIKLIVTDIKDNCGSVSSKWSSERL